MFLLQPARLLSRSRSSGVETGRAPSSPAILCVRR